MTFKLNNLIIAGAFVQVFLCLNYVHAQSDQHPHTYTKSELKYMMRNGFDPTGYNWQNKQVNNLLDEALIAKKGTGGVVVLGMAVFSVTSVYSILIAFDSSQGSQQSSRFESEAVFFAGVGALAATVFVAFAKRNKARQKVKSATLLYESLNRKRNRDSYNDFFKKEGK